MTFTYEMVATLFVIDPVDVEASVIQGEYSQKNIALTPVPLWDKITKLSTRLTVAKEMHVFFTHMCI